METGIKPVITSKLLRIHNLQSLGRGLLFLTGSVAVVCVWMTLAWCIWGIVTGQMSFATLSWRGVVFMGLFAAVIFRWGLRNVREKGDSIWDQFQDENGVDPGIRISRKMEANMVVAGSGPVTYAMLGPRWLLRGIREFRSWIPVSDAQAEQLEEVRRHLAARECWEPLSSFSHHEESLRQLALLKLVTVREYSGVWCLRVSLAGQTDHSSEGTLADAD